MREQSLHYHDRHEGDFDPNCAVCVADLTPAQQNALTIPDDPFAGLVGEEG